MFASFKAAVLTHSLPMQSTAVPSSASEIPSSPSPHGGGAVPGIARMEALLEAQAMELEALRASHDAVADLSIYLRTLAHQVRTPLGTILAALGLMEGGLHSGGMSPTEASEYVQFINDA